MVLTIVSGFWALVSGLSFKGGGSVLGLSSSVCRSRATVVFLAFGLAVLAGCLQPRPPAKLDTPVPVSAAYLLTFADRPDVESVPDQVVETLETMLGARNLQPKSVTDDALLRQYEAVRETGDRLELLAQQADGAPLVFLVETRVRFDTRFAGRQRWNVVVKATIAPTENLAEADTTEFSVPSFLDYDHQDERDALRYIDDSLAEQISRMVDRFLQSSGAGVKPPTASKSPKLDGGGNSGGDGPRSGEAGESPPFEWGDAIYFVMVDRFFNGVPDNDQTTDPTDPQAWHGGDIAGVQQKLDYIDNLGMTHVWLSPVWDARDAKFHGHGAFHGYWTENLAAIEPRLGTRAELVALARAAREQEVSLLLDMVLNHVGPDAPLVAEKPAWFHGHGGITDWNDPLQITDYDVHGLPDLDQDNPEVYAHLLSTSIMWASLLKPAGFRLDAVKHVSDEFWTRYNAEIARRFGDDFVMLGEVLDGNPRVTAEAMHSGGFNALFDFPLHFALVDVFCRGAHPGRIGAILAADRMYPESLHAGHRRGLVTLLDNHDLPRIASVCEGEESRVESALEMMLALRGTPSFTWGTEIPLTGTGEPENRADMDFDTDAALDDTIRDGMALRRKHRVLVDGRDEVLSLSADSIVLARLLPDSAAVVAWNRDETTDDSVLPEWFNGGELVLEGAVSVWVATGDYSDQFDEAAAPSTREIVVSVTGAPGAVRLAGSAPEVGAWEFEGAVPLEGGVARVKLPVGQVVALKFAATVDGAEVWEQRADRFVLVEAGDEPLKLEFDWEG